MEQRDLGFDSTIPSVLWYQMTYSKTCLTGEHISCMWAPNTLFCFKPELDTFPGLLQYISHISFNLFIQSAVKYILYIEISFLVHKKEKFKINRKDP